MTRLKAFDLDMDPTETSETYNLIFVQGFAVNVAQSESKQTPNYSRHTVHRIPITGAQGLLTSPPPPTPIWSACHVEEDDIQAVSNSHLRKGDTAWCYHGFKAAQDESQGQQGMEVGTRGHGGQRGAP